MSRPLILLTNDDGFDAPPLHALAEALEAIGEVHVYAPSQEQSAVGHGISLHRPLRVREVRPRWFRVDGTPTDCVLLAVRKFLDAKPALVMSGINTGPNLGDDVTYSGTVAGAYEGMLLGIPAIAVSSADYDTKSYDTAAHFGAHIARHVLKHGLPPNTVLNVNVPELPVDEIQGIAITRQGLRNYEDEIIERKDPRGSSYYWIGGMRPRHIVHPGTDFEAIEQNKVSVTPLHRDLTNFAALEELKKRDFSS